MTVYQLCVSDVESCRTICICSTLEIAERELFKARDRLIKEWKESHERWTEEIASSCKKNNLEIFVDDSYLKMIKNLESNDYRKWNNYPHEVPWIQAIEILDK